MFFLFYIIKSEKCLKIIFSRNLSNASNDKSSLSDKDKTERLVCFTLATLSYLETLVQKLGRLSSLFPIDECNIEIRNLKPIKPRF